MASEDGGVVILPENRLRIETEVWLSQEGHQSGTFPGRGHAVPSRYAGIRECSCAHVGVAAMASSGRRRPFAGEVARRDPG
jgi:hypothetical protein